MSDIIQHLNELNVVMEGRNWTIVDIDEKKFSSLEDKK